jgi:hypothetical protein
LAPLSHSHDAKPISSSCLCGEAHVFDLRHIHVRRKLWIDLETALSTGRTHCKFGHSFSASASDDV